MAVYAPGKLFIAGEYAVVEPGSAAIIVAVDRYIKVTSHASDTLLLRDEIYGSSPQPLRRDTAGVVTFETGDTDLAVTAVSVFEQFRAAAGVTAQTYRLSISSELEDSSGDKFGLGSSGAVVVAVIGALAEIYGVALSSETHFKLALLTTVQHSPRASGGDLAAAVCGGWVYYTSPDRDTLRTDLQAGGVAAALSSSGWAGCRVQKLATPEAQLLVGWTGTPAVTDKLVAAVSGGTPAATREYREFVAASDRNVDRLRDALCAGDTAGVLECIHTARTLLQHLSDISNIKIETEKLAGLCEAANRYGAAAKSSGAGGGDCGIALLQNPAEREQIMESWIESGVSPLRVTVCEGSGDSFECEPRK